MSNGSTELPLVTVTATAPTAPAAGPSALSNLSTMFGQGIGAGSLSGMLVYHTVIQILYSPNLKSETEGQPAGEFKDISSMFPPAKVLNFRYEDHISFQTDELELIFPDPQDVIINSDRGIKKGDWLKVRIHQWNADYPGSHTMADPGAFQIDQIKQMGPPTQTVIMATSVPISSTIKLTLKNAVRMGVTNLYDLAKFVADENGLQFRWDVSPKGNIFLSQTEQYNESDFQMLTRYLRSRALSMKIKDQTLIVFDEQAYEIKDPVYTIDFGNRSLFVGLPLFGGSGHTPRGITHWELTTQSQDIYSLASFSFVDPYTGQETSANAIATPGTADGTNERLNIHEDPTTAKIDTPGEDIAQGEGT